MYDRRIDSKAHTFGDEGVYDEDAMVWWDHETESLWSQWTAAAFSGAYKGVRLTLIAAPVETWTDWTARYSDSLVLDVPLR